MRATNAKLREQLYFTTAEAGEYLRVSVDVIKAAARGGALPGKRTGTEKGKFLFRRQDLDAWFASLEDVC